MRSASPWGSALSESQPMKAVKDGSSVVRRFPVDARYLAGVSGGRDSVALLHWLIHLGYRNLVVCHLNHQLRGRAGSADADFVRRLVERYKQRQRLSKQNVRAAPLRLKLQFACGSANVRALAKRKRISLESAAREARYLFFAKEAKRHRCRVVFLAHHADDLVETFLINLFRGAGLSGLATMREVSIRPVDGVNLTLVRPFLDVWRDQIDQYVAEQRLAFREDASNRNLTPLRNRIRHRIIPYLEKMAGRNIRHNIWRTARIAAEEEDWMESQSPPLDRIQTGDANKTLGVETLRALPVPLQRRAILKWLRASSVRDVGFDTVERVRSLLHQAHPAKVNLPGDQHARRRAGRIFIE